jgi:hypothetical protein
MSSMPLARRPLPARRVPLRAPLSWTGHGAACPAGVPGYPDRRASLPGRRVRRATEPGAACAREILRAADRGPLGRPGAHRDRFGADATGGAEPLPAPSGIARRTGVAA